jgi:hypothetical protein
VSIHKSVAPQRVQVQAADSGLWAREGEDFTHRTREIFRGLKSEPDDEIGQKIHVWIGTRLILCLIGPLLFDKLCTSFWFKYGLNTLHRTDMPIRRFVRSAVKDTSGRV